MFLIKFNEHVHSSATRSTDMVKYIDKNVQTYILDK